jgi:serine/threonine protein kinase
MNAKFYQVLIGKFIIILRHKNIIFQYGCFSGYLDEEYLELLKDDYPEYYKYFKNQSLNVVMPLMKETLSEKIKYLKKENLLTENLIIKILYELLDGLNHLHKCKIVHRDLKEDNILFDYDDNLVIVDFGMSMFCNNRNTINIGFQQKWKYKVIISIINTRYMPPDIAKSKNDVNYEKSDIWSAGMIIYNIIEKFDDIDTRNFQLKKLKKLNNNFKDIEKLLSYMLDENPNNRKSTKELLNIIEENYLK